LNEIQISLKLSPNSYYSLLILGKIFQKQENLDQAIKVFKLATIRYPDLAEAYNYWAEVLGQKGLYQEAIRLCHTALKINPYFDSAMFTLGLNYSLAGEFDQAIEEFKQYLLINPSSAEAQAEIEKARFKSKAR